MQYYEVYLLFGSNLGDKAANIANAITRLENSAVQVIKLSSFYETDPWGNTNQPKFVNLAGKFRTTVSPGKLMEIILETEQGMGRKRTKKWEPRIIDIDILFFGNEIIAQKDLRIPHPEIANRKFALTPLAEIAPAYIHPSLKKNIRQLLDECADNMNVGLLKQ